MQMKCSNCGHTFPSHVVARAEGHTSLTGDPNRTPPHVSPHTHRSCPGGTLVTNAELALTRDTSTSSAA
jgi:hypothetical protein